MGVLFVAAALLFFLRAAFAGPPAGSACLFSVLMLTDTSALLMTRHDWGPVALALALRLGFAGVWIASARNPTRVGSFIGGLIVGLAIFEKLSAVVLLIPFSIFLFGVRGRFREGGVPALLGFVSGIIPLLVVNLASLRRGAGLISLSAVQPVGAFRLKAAIDHAWGYLTLGHGEGSRGMIFGDYTSFAPGAEAALLLILQTIVVVAAVRRRSNLELRLAAGCAASYLLIGIALFLMPATTSNHHWILGTPFQYAAVALAWAGLSETDAGRRGPRVCAAAMLAAALILFIARIPNVAAVEGAFAQGKASAEFDPEFTRLAEMAAMRADEAVFVAADWGTANQIYCLANGKPDFVYEPFWGEDTAANARGIASTTTKRALYVVVAGIAPAFAGVADPIEDAIAEDPLWEEAPVEREFAELRRIRVRKFERRD
jgi:hypothetical protein